MARQSRTQQPPLQRLAAKQKRDDLNPLIVQTEHDCKLAFAMASADVAPLLAQFAKAYQAELARINADRDEDEESDPQRVPHAWLTTSGWGKRIEAAMEAAAHKAGQRCLAHLIAAQGDAGKMGQQHARELMQLAMQPAVKAIIHRRGHMR